MKIFLSDRVECVLVVVRLQEVILVAAHLLEHLPHSFGVPHLLIIQLMYHVFGVLEHADERFVLFIE